MHTSWYAHTTSQYANGIASHGKNYRFTKHKEAALLQKARHGQNMQDFTDGCMNEHCRRIHVKVSK